MLLLIALANVTWWTSDTDPSVAATADRVWVFVRTLFIDGRAYPLFSMLFGFGLATIASRYGDATEARRVLRRRGWWLLAFGVVHAVVFAGDVLGAYGLAAVLLAGLIAKQRHRLLIVLGVGIAVVSTATYYGGSMAYADGMEESSPPPASSAWLDLPVVGELATWAFITVGSVVMTAVVPCIVIGVFIQRSGILAEVARHRRLLGVTAVVGLALAAALAVPAARAELAGERLVGVDALAGVGSYPGGIGWLAAIAVIFAGRAEQARAAASTLAAIGKRSMTGYIGQTILFAPTFALLKAFDMAESITPVVAAGMAVLVWLIVGACCVALERAGRPGPFEALNKRLIYGKRAVTASSGAAA